MRWIENVTRNLVIMSIALIASPEVFAGEIFEYRRLADLDKDLEGTEQFISYIKSISISAHIVGVHLEEVLQGDELREVVLPGGKIAYLKSRKISFATNALRWRVFFLPNQLLIDDYGIADKHREAMEHAMTANLYLTHEGKPFNGGKSYGVGSVREVVEEEQISYSSFKITGVRGDLTVFLRGDRYKLIPLGGPQNDHLLIEVDVSKMPRGCGVGSE